MRNKIVVSCFSAVLLFVLAFGFFSTPVFSGDTPEANINTIISDGENLNFNLHTPDFTLNADGVIEAAGLSAQTKEPGSPTLPFFTTFVALPPGAEAHVTVIENEVTSHAVDYVLPSPEAVNTGAVDQITSMDDLEMQYHPNPDVYGVDSLFPEQAYSISEPMYYRDMRLARLTVYPLRYNPVQGELRHVIDMDIEVHFIGGDGASMRVLPTNEQFYAALSDQIINFDDASEWRGISQDRAVEANLFPTDKTTFKIEVDSDGVYVVTYDDLAAAGMAVDVIDPNTFEMMYRGASVAYEFVGDGDAIFETGEAVRFFGEAFDGPRLDEQYVTYNVYWLWADGTPLRMSDSTNPTGFQAVDSYWASVVEAPVNFYFGTWSNRWDMYENEPDAFFWSMLNANNELFTVDLSAPTATGTDAEFEVEAYSAIYNSSTVITATLNNDPSPGTRTFSGKFSFNVVDSVPANLLVDGANQFEIKLSPTRRWVMLNEIRVQYMRYFVAENDQLIFDHELTGQYEFNVDGFSEGDVANVLVWNITNELQPTRISMDSADISSGDSGQYAYRIGSEHDAGERFVATTSANVLAPVSISRYDSADLIPADGGANWLAISHGDFITETQRLAEHRTLAQFGGLQTHVTDVEDVINQYGYGLPLPEAVRTYLKDAVAAWSIPPEYILLVGDATNDPRDLRNYGSKMYMPTFLMFKDRFQGLIPSDHPYSLLVGDDDLPDVAVGRLAVMTADETAAMVDKIILYEQNHLSPEEWMTNMVFVSDNTDSGGNFCEASQDLGTFVPDSFNKHQLCLIDSPTVDDVDDLRSQLFSFINNGNTILNYRGHGSVTDWGGSPKSHLHRDDATLMTNIGKPFVIISADCLDGHFTWINVEAISETFMQLEGAGTAAHWSSGGLGYLFEYTVMDEGFYQGLFDRGLTAIGDAIKYAKLAYVEIGYSDSVAYALTLQGDPAMQLMRSELSLTKSAVQQVASAGDHVDFVLTVRNDGLFPVAVTVVDSLPTDLGYISTEATLPFTATKAVTMNDVEVATASKLSWGESLVITVTTQVDLFAVGGTLTNVASVSELPPMEVLGNEVSSASIDIERIITAVELESANIFSSSDVDWAWLPTVFLALTTMLIVVWRRRQVDC